MEENTKNKNMVMKQRTAKDYAMLSLKGMGMGAADVVPGVSGGTIAFIVGIYEELINSIKSADKAIFFLIKGKLKDFWRAINGSFLLFIIIGIAISFLTFAKLITWALDTYPVPIWAFFFGLVLASTLFVVKQVNTWTWTRYLSFVIGAAIAYYITIATPAATPDDLWFIFLSGAIAICAMILPGISGSFILLLLGKYKYMMQAISELNIPVVLVFVCGAAIGIVLFSKFLSYLLKNYADITIASLAGFMLGSLNKIWPWKEKVIDLDLAGSSGSFVERNILSTEYLVWAIFAAVIGFFLVYILEKLSDKKTI